MARKESVPPGLEQARKVTALNLFGYVRHDRALSSPADDSAANRVPP